MTTPPLSDHLLQEAVDALSRVGTKQGAARELGLHPTTFAHRLVVAQKAGIKANQPKTDIELPDFPDEDVPVEDIIDMMSKRFTKRKISHDAHTWFPVKIKENLPIGILWLGDPHVDDNGCNWPLLKHHAALCRETPGLYAVNLGDSSNNWTDRLVKLYAQQDSSVKTARRLVEWLLLKSGIKFLAILIGNHDAWGDGSHILMEMAKRHGTARVLCHDWEARFRLVFPNGTETRVWAAHNFPGNSIWNPLHGPLRAGKTGADAHLLACGDFHNWAVFRFENAERGLTQTFIRARGYKFMDDYARRLGKVEQERGSAILTVIDPSRPPGEGITVFDDIDRGVEFLTKIRGSDRKKAA